MSSIPTIYRSTLLKHKSSGRISYHIPYFFSYKTEVFYLPKHPKNLDLSYKMDLDLCDCLGRVKLYYNKISYSFYKMDLDLCDCLGRVKLYYNKISYSFYNSHSREGKTLSYSRINMVDTWGSFQRQKISILWQNKNGKLL